MVVVVALVVSGVWSVKKLHVSTAEPSTSGKSKGGKEEKYRSDGGMIEVIHFVLLRINNSSLKYHNRSNNASLHEDQNEIQRDLN